MRWTRHAITGMILGLGLVGVVWAVTQTLNPIPASNTTFLTDLQRFLRDEDAQRFVHHFQPFVVQNGLHGAGAGLTGNPGSTIAYPAGYYSSETASITYPDASNCWVIMSSDTAPATIATFTRVAGTKYLLDCVSGTQPATPAGTVYLMKVTTAAGAITGVVDLRPRTPVGVASGGTGLTTPLVTGDIVYAPSTTAWGRLADAVDGNVLRSGGVGSIPLYGKVRISGATTDITGTLPLASGGTALTGTPTNGQLLIGNGTGYTLAGLTAGSNITVTPGAGTITIAASTPSGGLAETRNLVCQNDSGTPNSLYGCAADLVALRNATDNTVVVRVNTGTITNDVTVSGPAANGRDQSGSFSASSWVHFYLIWNGTTLASLSSTCTQVQTGGACAAGGGPNLPTGYTHLAYTSTVRYNATPLLVKTRTRGPWAFYEVGQNVLTTGGAITETTISLSAIVPPNAPTAVAYVRHIVVGSATATIGHLRYVTGQDLMTTKNLNSEVNSENAMTMTMPVIGQQWFYLFTTSGTADNYTIDVQAYSVPNGG